MGRRHTKNQSTHDNRVRSEAGKLRKQGYRVQADLPGHDKPEPIGKDEHIPDIIATKHGTKKIIEVETPETIDADKKQHEAFKRSAAQKQRTTFKMLVTRPKNR